MNKRIMYRESHDNLTESTYIFLGYISIFLWYTAWTLSLFLFSSLARSVGLILFFFNSFFIEFRDIRFFIYGIFVCVHFENCWSLQTSAVCICEFHVNYVHIMDIKFFFLSLIKYRSSHGSWLWWWWYWLPIDLEIDVLYCLPFLQNGN